MLTYMLHNPTTLHYTSIEEMTQLQAENLITTMNMEDLALARTSTGKEDHCAAGIELK